MTVLVVVNASVRTREHWFEHRDDYSLLRRSVLLRAILVPR